MTATAGTSPLPHDQQAWADEVDRLRQKRSFAAAFAKLEQHEPRAFKDGPARALLISRARIAVEHGQFGAAAEDYRSAAARGPEDPWLVADAYVNEYLDRVGRQGDASAVAQSVLDLKRELRSRLEAPSLTEPAPLQWALSVIQTGPHQDDDASLDAITDARHLLDAASVAVGGAASSDAGLRILRAQARLAWATARVAPDRRQAIRASRMELDRLREQATGKDIRLTIEYYEARVDMLDRCYDDAGRRLEAILRRDPGHQAAMVWNLYCRRVIGGESPDLLGRLRELLPADPYTEPYTPPEPGDAPRIFDRNFVAELLTERAAIKEESDPDAAARDYEQALRIRPRMVYAQRRLIEALVAGGRLEHAVAQGQAFIAAYEAWTQTLGTRMPCTLLVDVGIALNATGQRQAAIERFEEAIEIAPSYGFAHEARFATQRMIARSGGATDEWLDDQIRAAEDAIAGTTPQLVGTGGLTVELAHAHFGQHRSKQAIALFKRALEDASGVVRDRARAGLIDVYRLTRQFETASRCVPSAGAGPRTLAAAGWLSAECGDLQGALDLYQRALKERRHAASFVAARARTLRILGRPSAAWRALDEAEIPRHLSLPLDNERAWTALELGDVTEATRLFTEILEREPSCEPAYRGLIAAQGQAGTEWSEIAATLEEACIGLGGERPAVLAEAGLLRIRRRQLAEARRMFDRASELVSDSHTSELVSDSHTKATLCLLAGNEYLVVGAYDDALACLETLRRLEPPSDGSEDPRVALLNARVLTAAGDSDAGLAQFLRVGKRWPRSYYARMGQAYNHYQRQDYDAAAGCLRDLIEVSGDSVGAHERLAWTLVQAHEHDCEATDDRLREAQEHCDDVRRLEPTRSGIFDCLATIAAMRGMSAAADLYIGESSRNGVSTLESLRNRGALCLRLGRRKDAVVTLEEAIADPWADAATHTLLGIAYLECERAADAALELRQAALGDPRDPVAPVALANALERMDHREEARDVLSQALRTVAWRDRLPLLLAHARLLHTLAADKAGREAEILLDEALHDVYTAAQIQRRRCDAGDVEYHRGVLLYSRGSRRVAAQALKEATRLNPGNADARRAAALTAAAADSDPERLTRRWSIVLGVLAVVLIVAAILMNFAQAGWDAAAFQWGNLTWSVGVLLVLLVVAATLPRLTGMEFGRQVKLSLNAAAVTEPMSVSLNFRRLTPVAPRLMAGPSPYSQHEMPSDTEDPD